MRNINELRLKAQALAKAFNGLPKGYTHFNLCDDLADGRSYLGLDSDCICLLHFLIKRSRANDWKPGAQPLVAWSRFFVCHYFGWSEDKLRRVEKEIADLCFIAFIDTANCKRFLNRTADGTIAEESGGISLAPLGARLKEIVTAAHEQREEVKALFNTYGEMFRIRSDLLNFSKCKDLPEELNGLAATIAKKLPKRRNQKLTIGELKTMLTEAKDTLAKLRTYLGINDFEAKQQCLAAAELAATGEGQEATARARANPVAQCGREISAVNIQSLHRKNAVHKDPDSNSLKRDSNLLGILTASPEIFQAYLEHEHQRSAASDWQTSLTTALERYAQDLTLKPSVVGRLMHDYGYSSALKAVFALGRMAEKGATIHNPAAYALSLARKGSDMMQ